TNQGRITIECHGPAEIIASGSIAGLKLLHLAPRVAGTGEDIDGDQYEIAFSPFLDRKSTRLNSSHVSISYAVFCLKKKNTLRMCNIIIPIDHSAFIFDKGRS